MSIPLAFRTQKLPQTHLSGHATYQTLPIGPTVTYEYPAIRAVYS
jgi:hypothetical protein